MREPKIVSQLKVAAERIREAIASRGVPAAWAIAVAAVAAGGFSLLWDMGVVDKRVERLQTEVRSLRAQVTTLNAAITEMAANQGKTEAALQRIEDRVGHARTGLDLTESQQQTVLSFFNLRSAIIGPPKWKLGERVPASVLKPIPEELLKMVPALKGTKCAFDLNGYVAITDAFENRVIALLSNVERPTAPEPTGEPQPPPDPPTEGP